MDGGREGWKEGGMEGWREGGREGEERERRSDGGREGWREGGREGGKEEGWEGGRDKRRGKISIQCTSTYIYNYVLRLILSNFYLICAMPFA